MKCKDFGIKCTDCRYSEECVIVVVEENAPAQHTTIGWKCNKYNKFCVGMEPKKENMVLKEPEIKFEEYIGDDNVKMEIEFEDYYGNTVGEIVIERGDIYVKGRILPISKVEVADWESDNHVRLQSIKTNGGDNMNKEEILNDLIKVERWDRYMENVFGCAYYEYSKDEEIEDFLHEMKKIAEKYNIHIPSKDEVNWDNEKDIPEYIVHERIGNSIVTDIREIAKRELL